MRKKFFRTLGIIIVVYIGFSLLVEIDWGCTKKINPVWVYEQSPSWIDMGDDSFIYFFKDVYDSIKSKSYMKINKRNGQLSGTCLLPWGSKIKINKNMIGTHIGSSGYDGTISYFFLPHSRETFITTYKKYGISIKAYESVPIIEFIGIRTIRTRFIIRDTCEGFFVDGKYISIHDWMRGKEVLKTQKQSGWITSYMLDSTSIYLSSDNHLYRYDFEDLIPKEEQNKK